MAYMIYICIYMSVGGCLPLTWHSAPASVCHLGVEQQEGFEEGEDEDSPSRDLDDNEIGD